MGDYSDYRVNQGRLERAQDRAKRQKRTALLVGGVVAAVAVVFGLAASVKREPKAPPKVVVTWPSPHKYGKRTFVPQPVSDEVSSLGRVLARPGQPFTVSLVNPIAWDVTLVTASGKAPGATGRWSPAKDEALKIFIRPAVTGWRKAFAWMTPKTELRLDASVPRKLDPNRRAVAPVAAPDKAGANSEAVLWLSSNVAGSGDAKSDATWDERAIPLLEAAGSAVPYSGPKPGPGRSMPLPPPAAPRWNLVDGFGDRRTKGDDGSYFALDGPEALSEDAPIVMTKLARQIAARAPKASIKWIVADAGSADARATIRLEFDDSGARGGWVKKSGETQATPLRWWNAKLGETNIRNPLSPSMPR